MYEDIDDFYGDDYFTDRDLLTHSFSVFDDYSVAELRDMLASSSGALALDIERHLAQREWEDFQ